MKDKATVRSILGAAAVIPALLLCGCNNGGSDWDGDIDLVPPETTTTIGSGRPQVIRPTGDDEWDITYDGGIGFVNRLDHSQVNMVMKGVNVRDVMDGYNGVFIVLADNGVNDMVVKADTKNQTVDKVYTAALNSVCYTTVNDNLYCTCDNLLLLMDRYMNDVALLLLAEADSSIIKLLDYGFAEAASEKKDGVYVCDICSRNKEYVIWSDSNNNFYWYHPHSGENEYLENFDEMYFTGSELYSYEVDYAQSVGSQAYIEIVDLYRVNNATGERELILADITNFVSFYEGTWITTNIAYFEVDKVELGTGTEAYIAAFNKETGELNTLYTAKSDDMELISAYYKQSSAFLIKDGNEIICFDKNTLKATTLFRLENGMFSRYPVQYVSLKRYYQFHMGEYVEWELELLELDYPDDDFSDFYICDQCRGSDEYFIWEDEDENWFWYHPHSGKNEPVTLDSERYEYTPEGWYQPYDYITKVE